METLGMSTPYEEMVPVYSRGERLLTLSPAQRFKAHINSSNTPSFVEKNSIELCLTQHFSNLLKYGIFLLLLIYNVAGQMLWARDRS